MRAAGRISVTGRLQDNMSDGSVRSGKVIKVISREGSALGRRVWLSVWAVAGRSS